MTAPKPGSPTGGARGADRERPPPGMVAAAEQDYHAARDRLAVAVQGARLVLQAGDSAMEAFVEAYYALSRTDPGIAAVIGAAAIVQLATEPTGSAPTHP